MPRAGLKGKPPLKSIVSRAPTRIDLAGGTVDLWPLYLFLRDPVTLNIGIDLFAEARIEQAPRNDGDTATVMLRSDDQDAELKFTWAFLNDENAVKAPPSLELHLKLLRHFAKLQAAKGWPSSNYHFSLTTTAKSPAGAGLGGSSTLSIAMIGALATWAQSSPVDPVRDGERLVEIARDVETTVIQVPAGVQDYYGAMYGGLQSLKWGAGSHFRDWLPEDILPMVEERLMLFYSGQSRNSGINNWALFKAFIDKAPGTREKFEGINKATQALEAALRKHDWQASAAAIDAEWDIRRTLAPGISTPEIDRALADARKEAPLAAKICGAGGGGCFFVFLPRGPVDRDRIERVMMANGMRALPFKAMRRGLDIQVKHA